MPKKETHAMEENKNREGKRALKVSCEGICLPHLSGFF